MAGGVCIKEVAGMTVFENSGNADSCLCTVRLFDAVRLTVAEAAGTMVVHPYA